MSHADHLDVAVPAAYEALLAAGKAAGAAAIAAGLDHTSVELVRIRSSQLNGCAFCLHSRDAIAHGENTDRLAVLPAWRDSGYFTPIERAALAVAEEVTLIADHQAARRSRPEIDNERAALTPQQRAAVQWLTIVINAFNRIAVTSGYTVDLREGSPGVTTPPRSAKGHESCDRPRRDRRRRGSHCGRSARHQRRRV